MQSVADEDDLDKRRMLRVHSFLPFESPSEWPPTSVFFEMQRATDYCPELDLFIVAENEDYSIPPIPITTPQALRARRKR